MFLEGGGLRAQFALGDREGVEQHRLVARRRGGRGFRVAGTEVEILPRHLAGRDAHAGRLLAEAGNRGAQGRFSRGYTGKPEFARFVGEGFERRALHRDAHLFEVTARNGV